LEEVLWKMFEPPKPVTPAAVTLPSIAAPAVTDDPEEITLAAMTTWFFETNRLDDASFVKMVYEKRKLPKDVSIEDVVGIFYRNI